MSKDRRQGDKWIYTVIEKVCTYTNTSLGPCQLAVDSTIEMSADVWTGIGSVKPDTGLFTSPVKLKISKTLVAFLGNDLPKPNFDNILIPTDFIRVRGIDSRNAYIAVAGPY